MYRNVFQPRPACTILPPTCGATNPARLPIMFIEPETVPAYRPPTSIQVAHAPGITRSLKKLANAMKIIEKTAVSSVAPLPVPCIWMKISEHCAGPKEAESCR